MKRPVPKQDVAFLAEKKAKGKRPFDHDKTLAKIRECVASYDEADEADELDLEVTIVTLFAKLDRHLKAGGALPKAWQKQLPFRTSRGALAIRATDGALVRRR